MSETHRKRALGFIQRELERERYAQRDAGRDGRLGPLQTLTPELREALATAIGLWTASIAPPVVCWICGREITEENRSGGKDAELCIRCEPFAG